MVAPVNRQIKTRAAMIVLAASAILLVGYGIVSEDDGDGRSWIGAWLSSCKIKGNINSSGERIYHVPGQTYYRETRIGGIGERWFCSETEAQQAGWRRAKL